MNILVCIKQVPGAQKTEMDEKTGTIIRVASNARMNPFDLVALECALKLKEHYGGFITALTMGPVQAKSVLIEAMALGVDDVIQISGREFAGADVLATSRALSLIIQQLPQCYDVILCGQQSTDGDTAQVGPSLAVFLDQAHVSMAHSVVDAGDALVVEVREAHQIVTQKVLKPCVLTISKDAHTPRLPSFLRYQAVKNKEIRVYGADVVPGVDVNLLGLKGSPTQVKKIYTPQVEKDSLHLDESDALSVHKLTEYIQTKRLLED